jgi:hypothetical protein
MTGFYLQYELLLSREIKLPSKGEEIARHRRLGLGLEKTALIVHKIKFFGSIARRAEQRFHNPLLVLTLNVRKFGRRLRPIIVGTKNLQR